jgi:hypothetical protein
MIALVALGATPQGALANAIVVGHDINTLGSTVAGAQEDSFAVNVASFLTSGSPVRSLLLFESNPGDGTRNFATGVLNALSAAGFVVTVTSNYSTSFAGYDAVFVAQDYPIVGFLDNTALVNYVDGGGSVYLAGGVGPSAGTEAAGWSGFLNHYGLAYATAYNGINSVTITGTDPIFSGITALRSGNGQSILDLGTNPNAHIVQFSGTQGVYAVVSVPEPGNALLLAGGLVVLSLLRRRQVVRGGGAIRPAFL